MSTEDTHITAPTGTKPKSSTKDMILGCGCLSVLAIGIIAGIGAAVSSNSHDTAKPAAKASTAADTASKPAAAKQPTATPADSADQAGLRILGWYNGAGKTHINALVTDTSTISSDAGNGDFNSVATDCTQLATDVGDARADDPIPDSEAQKHWAAALAHYQKAAADCATGASNVDADLISKGGDEMTAGTGELSQASARIKEINDSVG